MVVVNLIFILSKISMVKLAEIALIISDRPMENLCHLNYSLLYANRRIQVRSKSDPASQSRQLAVRAALGLESRFTLTTRIRQ